MTLYYPHVLRKLDEIGIVYPIAGGVSTIWDVCCFGRRSDDVLRKVGDNMDQHGIGLYKIYIYIEMYNLMENVEYQA